MSDRVFFDTNILIYAFEKTATDKTIVALRMLRQAIVEDTGCISDQVLNEFFSVAFRKFRPGMTVQEAHRVLDYLSQAYKIVPSSSILLRRAFDLHHRFYLQWYDCLIVAAAHEADCTILYTEDLQHGQKIDQLVS